MWCEPVLLLNLWSLWLGAFGAGGGHAMLSVRIEGHEVETTPAALARLVFEGKVDRHSPAKAPAGVAEQPLEQFLEAPHCEALTGELHRRLRRMCSLDSSAVDLQELCIQVERLCQWRWPNLPLAARFFWTAAWLNELADRAKSAIDFYDAFLLLPAPEHHLRLLALNNRGVLRIRLGWRDGIQDLARAGIADCGFGLRIADRAAGFFQSAMRRGFPMPVSTC